MKWRPSRAALIDFWVFDYQEFHFSDGKMLLRGENGSGKSVTMQSLFPVMLDGNISPKRLDPFGSRDRKMDYYVLFENKMEDRTERTSYILLEFEKPGEDRYITLGMGINGRKGKNKLDVWYFIVNNNTRYRQDFDVIRTRTNLEGEPEMVTYQKAELRKNLGDGVMHFDEKDKEQYATTVNKLLFGFPSMDVFQNWIELLVQLRTPKLSNAKDMNFKAVYEILKKSMPGLTDDELRVLIDSIQHIDNIHDDVQASTVILKSLQIIAEAYNKYNSAVIREKAKQYTEVYSREIESKKKLEKIKADQINIIREKQEMDQRIIELSNEETVILAEKEIYDDHEALGLLEKQERLEKELKLKSQQAQDKTNQYHAELKKKKNGIDARDQTQTELDAVLRDLEETQEEAAELAEEGDYLEHNYYVQQQSPDYKAWIQSVQNYQGELNAALEKLSSLKAKELRLKEILDERAEYQKDFDTVTDDSRKLKEELIGLQERYMQELSSWRASVRSLSLDDDQKKELFTLASMIAEERGFDSVKSLITIVARKQEKALVQKKSENKQALNDCDKKRIEVKAELTRWQQMIDPEPARSAGADAFRKSLRHAGVPHAPLFALIDWKENVCSKTRLDLESALFASGLLDALIAPSLQGKEVLEDCVLQSTDEIIPQGSLLDYVVITTGKSGISEEQISRYVSSISVSEGGEGHTIILPDKQYRIGALVGHAQTVDQCYVGKAARDKLRSKMIEMQQKLLQEQDESYTLLRSEQDRLQRELFQIAEDEKQLPVPSDILKALQAIAKLRSKLDSLQESLDNTHRQHSRVYDECRVIRKDLQNLKLTIELTVPGCKNAILATQAYVNAVHDIQNKTIRQANFHSNLIAEQERIDEIEDRIIEVRGEQIEIDADIAAITGNLQALEQRLNEVGADLIQERIRAIVFRLNEITIILRNALKQSGILQSSEEKIAIEVIDAQNEHARCVQNTVTAEQILKEELTLPIHEDIQTDLLSFAKSVGNRPGTSSENAGVELNNVLLQERLLDYPFELKLMFENRGGLIAQRRGLDVATGVGRLNPNEAVKEVSEKLEQLKMSLSEEHQRLFEDIILNTLGQTIREKITKTKRWIANLNRVMQKRNASISFRLEWKGKRAESLEELHTTELVELLMAKPELLNESDHEKIAKHFRAQIDRAREWASDETASITIQDALRILLDYREWYDFKLECYKDNKWAEVNKTFLNTASGGQRALSVYVPLFSALHACYEGANDDAARLVTLDEAFAGVDDRNITEMFDLIEEMDISYVLTSQALWGDYPTVKSLSISHILRPQHANYASVAQFYWNGVERVPLMSKEVEVSFDEQLELSI
ncbi:Putative exonuclease SbcCD, C subunit [Paenibacillus sp. yr247]|uniref:SbcC/MukB-like Walker B domain-containing protein n=1 Tax=Paenibacillus sp. yr247 TaxID=1761880 RepID=UPI0008848E84|nr:SbcC/MukB-like Walker B domain-containing protein [Paenibacillus sp. yr247]SDN61571.1 Putative exonuclease SbcCD, C subunit [Paenibacillus sp. yr247]